MIKKRISFIVTLMLVVLIPIGVVGREIEPYLSANIPAGRIITNPRSAANGIAGFNASDDEGNQYLITAGHVADVNDTIQTEDYTTGQNVNIGTTIFSDCFEPGVYSADYSVIRLDLNIPQNTIEMGSSTTTRYINSYAQNLSQVLEYRDHTFGYSTQSGFLREIEFVQVQNEQLVYRSVDNNNNAFAQGDSGTPIYANDDNGNLMLIGILSSLYTQSGTTYYTITPAYKILDDTDLTVNVHTK